MVSPSKSEPPVVTIRLTLDEAIVLDALFDQVKGPQTLDITDPADVYAVWRVSGALERGIPALFDPNYSQILASARDQFRAAYGAATTPSVAEQPDLQQEQTVVFAEPGTGEKCVAIIRRVQDGIAIALSRETDGDLEVTLSRADARLLYGALTTLLGRSKP